MIHLLLLETPELVLNPLEVLLGADRSEGRLRTLALGELDGEEGAGVAAQRPRWRSAAEVEVDPQRMILALALLT